jgi:hypothetical protein
MAAITAQPAVRTIVFSAHVRGNAEARESLHGANAGESDPNGQGMSGYNSGNGVDADVRIRVKVLAVQNDGSLFAEISEDGPNRTSPAIQLAVTKDGQIILGDPDAPLLPEETTLLTLLARDFVSGHDAAAGSSWTLPFDVTDNGLHVSVTGDPNGHVALSLRGEEVQNGDTTVRRRLDGTVLYDAAHSIPVQADLTTATQTQSLDRNSRENLSLQYKLQSDSLGGS